MANARADPLEEIIADGRLTTRPTHHYGVPEIITIDLDLLANSINANLRNVYLNDNRIRNQYIGGHPAYTQTLTNDITALVDYAVGQTYNRLRAILERKAPPVRVARMNTRCPVPANMEFPEWISSTLSAIGPCRLQDSPRDCLLVYASTTATMTHYGRANPVVFVEGHYHRLIAALRAIGARLAPFNHAGIEGSYFPTISPEIGANVWTLYGQVHHSHYENEDCARIAFVTSPLGVTPFENVGVTIGYVDDPATVDALAAVAAPPDLPPGQTADFRGRPVGGQFNVNYYGIQLAVAAQGNVPAQRRGVYLLGRGMERYYQCVLANNVATTEVLEILRYRLLR